MGGYKLDRIIIDDLQAMQNWEFTSKWFTPELQAWTDEIVDSEQWKHDDLIQYCIELTEDIAYEPGNLKVSESPEAFQYLYKRIIKHTLNTVENLA